MIHHLYLIDIYSDIINVVKDAYTWGIAVLIFGTAALLAASLIGWLIHRS